MESLSTSPRCQRRVLLVHDDAVLVRALAAGLSQAGHQVVQPAPTRLVDEVGAGGVDLVVLEPALLPLDEVLALCATARRPGGALLALVSRRQDERVETVLLGAGADEYLHLPASPSVVLAHLLAMVRRSAPPLGGGLRPVSARWSLDERGRRLIGSNRVQPLPDLQYRLLVAFLDRPGAVLGRPELLAAVWGSGYGNGREVDQYVYYLRRKVEAEPTQPRVIITAGRAGYL